jgi:UDP-glucose 4-epimerase
MRAIVTGGAGFIGSHIAEALVKDGFEVLILDDLSSGQEANVPEGASFVPLDIRDRDGVMRVFEDFRPEVVSHQAAQASVSVSVARPLFDAEVNVLGGLNVLEAAREVGVRHFLFASTGGAIYGEVPEGTRASEDWPAQPKSPYAASKAGFEHYLAAYQKNHGLAYTALRYGNVYGPRQNPHGEAGVVAIFSNRLLKGEPVVLFARSEPGDPGGVRDYIHVDDVVAAHQLALRKGLVGVYNVGTGEGHTTEEVLRTLAAALGVEPKVRFAPPRPGDLEVSVLDPAKLMAEGWQPRVSFEEGLARTAEWFRRRLG